MSQILPKGSDASHNAKTFYSKASLINNQELEPTKKYSYSLLFTPYFVFVLTRAHVFSIKEECNTLVFWQASKFWEVLFTVR